MIDQDSKIFLNLGIFLVVNVSEVVSDFKGTEKTLKWILILKQKN